MREVCLPVLLEVKTERQTEEANLCSVPSGNAGSGDTPPQGEFALLFSPEQKEPEPDVDTSKRRTYKHNQCEGEDGTSDQKESCAV